jgi:hypothetical protein
MSRHDRRLRVATTIVAMLIVVSAGAGCTAKAQKSIIGTWRTRLTGYNTVAAGITQYDQTVVFTDAGVVTMDNTLPGDVNHVTGRYELTKTDGHPVIKITWDIPVDKPSELYYSFQGDKLLTSRAPGSLDMSKQLNVGNQDPVVYVRLEKPPPQ